MHACVLISEEAAKKEQERWKNQVLKYESMEKKGEYFTLLTRIDSFLESCKYDKAKKDGIMYSLKIMWILWTEHCRHGRSQICTALYIPFNDD